ncbi:MAG: hypothetical protein WCH01_15355 [Methylococcaceae bacterium]
MTSESELEKAILKCFVILCLNFGKFTDQYSLETIEALETASHKLAQFTRALRLKLAEKLEAANEEGQS